MEFAADDLVSALAAASRSEYVRIVAHWMTRGEVAEKPASLSGNRLVDALTAAAVAQRARDLGRPVPPWTYDDHYVLPSFWSPGGDRFFAYSLAHTPPEFGIRGLIIEDASLASV